MNDDHDPGLGDLGTQLDAAASSVHVDADVGDVHRRLRHQRRARGGAVTAVVAIAAVASVVVWQGGDQPVSVASSDASTTLPTRGGTAADGSGGSTDATRKTAEGLRVSLSTMPGYSVPSTPWWTPPAKCRGKDLPVITVVDPTRGSESLDSAVSVRPRQIGEAVTVDATLVYVGKPLVVEGVEGSGLTTSTLAEGSTVVTPATGMTVIAGASIDGTLGDVSTNVPEPDAWVIAVSVAGDEVRHANVTFANGTTDEADAVHGMLGLAARYPEGPAHLRTNPITRAEISLEHGDPIVLTDLSNSHVAFDEHHAQLDTTTATTITNDPVSAECTAPPAPLPAAGGQPSDAVAAEAAVTGAVQTFMDGSKPEAEREAAMLDPEHGRRIQQELGTGYAAAMTSARVTVTDLVFVSPTTAIVRYDLDVTPTGTEPLAIPTNMFHDSLAKVVFQDGRWLVTPQSLCRITSVATPIACTGMTSMYPDEVYGPGGSAT